MTNQTQTPTDILMAIGEMKGQSQANFAALFDHLNLIRADIHRVEAQSKEEVKQLQGSFNRRFTDVDGRIAVLEADNKQQIADIAKHSLIGGSIAASLVSAAIELIKRI